MGTFICPNCGGEVPDKAKACPHCGSDENTGWSDETNLDDLNLFTEEDYEEFLEREGFKKREPSMLQRFIAITSITLIILYFMYYNWHCK